MPFMRLFFLFVAMVAGSFCGDGSKPSTPPSTQPPAAAPTRPATVLPTREITVEGDGKSVKLIVELATTNASRTVGLMNRPVMPEDAGMLFFFRQDLSGGFWMANTLIPLDIAYLDANGKVLEIRAGKPLDQTPLTPAQPYRNTLEVNGGWFQRNGLGPGAIVKLPADAGPIE